MITDEEKLAELDSDFDELMRMVDDMSVSADEFDKALKKSFLSEIEEQ
jgi:hypothetical protein